MIKRMNIQRTLLILDVYKVVGDEFLSWLKMCSDFKVLSLLL